MEIKVSLLPEEERGSVPEDESQLGFGKIFADHMYTTFFKDGNWRESCIEPFGPFVLSPAALVLHYGQEIFEGMKAFRQTNKKDVSLFRPEKNAERMKDSAKRISMEPLPEDQFLEALHKLINIERKWVPHNPGTSLYIRPTMIATESLLGHRKSNEYLFYIILSPVGSYFKEGFKPIRIYVEPEYVRAVKGGVGEAKTGGNYAATLLAMDKAFELGCSQVMWLDASEHKYIEEVGPISKDLYESLTGIQYGKIEDPYGWNVVIK